jgi:peptidoglycan/LPS O-acetylase OafA/YrhL
LRAVAVLAVIADHIFKYPKGGFVGVDIFFVISGFLITGLLLKEHARFGRISMRDFYKRRVRRIAPVAVLVLAVTVALSWLLYTATRAQNVTIDGLWSFFFAANWRLALIGTDYMQNEGPASPLQHFWSLAVEEQFYLLWPLMIIAILGATATDKMPSAWRKSILLPAMLVITAASFAWAIYESAANPTWAYFSTFARAWELGIGALLAAGTPLLARVSAKYRPAMGWVGLAGIVASLFLISPTSTFPAPWAVLPVLSTALVIASGIGADATFLTPLTNPVSRYIGDISYSLYLWHWPVTVFLAAYMPQFSLGYCLLAVGLSLALSIASYHGVEDRIRKSDWLDPHAARSRDKSKKKFHLAALLPKEMSEAAKLGLLGSLAIATAGIVLVSLTPPPPPVFASTAALPSASANGKAAAAATLTDKAQVEIQKALSVQAWPQLNPSIEGLGDSAWAPEVYKDGCLTIVPEKFGVDCVYGPPSATKTAVVMGDSMAASWMPAIRSALDSQGYKISMLTRSGCPVFTVELTKGQDECRAQRDASIAYVNETDPDLVIISNLDAIGRTTSGSGVDRALAEWQQGGAEALGKLSEARRIVVLSVPPRTPNLNSCAVAGSSPASCAAQITDMWRRVAAKEMDAVGAASKGTDRLKYVDVSSWFCTTSGACPAFIGNAPVRVDGIHMTGAYTSTLGPLMAEALAEGPAKTAPRSSATSYWRHSHVHENAASP